MTSNEINEAISAAKSIVIEMYQYQINAAESYQINQSRNEIHKILFDAIPYYEAAGTCGVVAV
jgi:hypothetical protein